ncbi:ABC transporter ATP-binding protein [Aquabacter spiritensis]|uniref:Amino acid/amide ABC transporter ATP-binding protein 1 (HAAT family) n=1 Tax=Aquabacter spiritensis TaxID=933073 RepID=A0A4R3M2Y0_9HYPH|nr:ABC transporter ATP-binding protein [Aquabacter spiritensis]TCT05505.1 amino acid/amide ABC transporter ATP-binding protein 1 (HAAT family) [Aquabacter spiritensis]
MAALLETRGVSRRFGGLLAVDSVDLDVTEGEVHGLIGPNGAGKTTMLNLLSGHLPVSTGTILFAGADITRLPSERRAAAGIRRTFQNLKLFREMTALENVMVGLHASTRAEIFHALLRTRFQKREEADIAEKARAALAFVGLTALADQPAGSLPYGHQRLLEIARAFVAEPRLLLLDEPAAGLNASESRHLVDFIFRIRSAGTTIILIEHHMDVVMPTCDRITVLNYGKLLARGTPKEIRADGAVIGAYLGKGAVAAAAAVRKAEAAHAAH